MTGWSSRPMRSLAGPSGCCQLAPWVHVHQFSSVCGSAGFSGGAKVTEPGCNCSSDGFGVPGSSCFFTSSQSMGRSATVLYWVAVTNLRNSALVTAQASIQKPSMVTLTTGFSSCRPPSSAFPIVKFPPGIQIIPGGFFAASDTTGAAGAMLDAIARGMRMQEIFIR